LHWKINYVAKNKALCYVFLNSVIINDGIDMSASVSFFLDKQSFLKKNIQDISSVEKLAAQKTHAYFLDNLYELEQEFDTIFHSLLQHPKDREKFWYYTYYCALQIEQFYRNYGQNGKADEMHTNADRIKRYLEGKSTLAPSAPVTEHSFIKRLYIILSDGIKDIIQAAKQASNLRSKVVMVNMLRLMYMVARLSWLNLAIVFNDTNVIERFNEIFNQNLSLELLQERLGTLQGISNVLSVALFAMRRIINSAMVVKHSAFPSEGEKQADWYKRFSFEIKKRHGPFLNDDVWTLVNLFTNYPMILGLNMPAVIGITVVFQVFDFALLVWLWHLEEQKFKAKNHEFLHEIKMLTNQKSLDQEQLKYLDVLLQQQRFLEINYKTSSAAFQMNCGAAFLLFSSFGTAFILATPLASLGAFFVSAIAISLYRSADNYADMIRKKNMLEQIHEFGGDKTAALNAYQEAKYNFAINMVKYTLMPTLIMGAMIVCWQAGLALILAYGAYELTQMVMASKNKTTELDMLIPHENGENLKPNFAH